MSLNIPFLVYSSMESSLSSTIFKMKQYLHHQKTSHTIVRSNSLLPSHKQELCCTPLQGMQNGEQFGISLSS